MPDPAKYLERSERAPVRAVQAARRTIELAILALCALLLTACRSNTPDADDWQLGAEADGIATEIALPAALVAGAGAYLELIEPTYVIKEQALYLPVVSAAGKQVFRYTIDTRQGQWQDSAPAVSGTHRPLLRGDVLWAGSRVARAAAPRPVAQPFGKAELRLKLEETTYTRRWYNIGFPFGQSGWMSEQYGDGFLAVHFEAPARQATLLLSQHYRADNIPFQVAWTADGRYVVAIEVLSEAALQRDGIGRPPALRLAVFGPFPVERTPAGVVQALAQADERQRQRELDTQLRDGRIGPEARYGPAYSELLATLRDCTELLAITGPIERLELVPSQTLELSDGRDDNDGWYFQFELESASGRGALLAAAFRPETPQAVRAEITRKIVPFDLTFNGESHRFRHCESQ
ncbi:MAG: hypothetical protein RQ729_10180 [Wenzhouxiangellaceae bacterium]|nr:hypothetical protein [Wenzhouxiangellaceae bacterium]